jgi:hypothetical protein
VAVLTQEQLNELKDLYFQSSGRFYYFLCLRIFSQRFLRLPGINFNEKSYFILAPVLMEMVSRDGVTFF